MQTFLFKEMHYQDELKLRNINYYWELNWDIIQIYVLFKVLTW